MPEGSEPQGGRLVWRYRTYAGAWPSPAVKEGVVAFGSDDNTVHALDATTGGLIWRYRTGGEIWSSPVVAGGVLYVGSNDGYVYALKASEWAP